MSGWEEPNHYYNKGVKSDFIRLYNLQLNKENTYTLSFSFDYLDLNETKNKIYFSCSLGKEEKLFSEKIEMNVEQCRDHLKSINSILKVSENCSYDEILETIQKEILGKNFFHKNNLNKKKKIK